MSDITEHDDQYYRALQRIDVLEDELEAQRQAIRTLKEALFESSELILSTARKIESNSYIDAMNLAQQSIKFKSIDEE